MAAQPNPIQPVSVDTLFAYYKKKIELLHVARVASVVSTLGALLLFGILPKFFTLALAGVVAFGAREVYIAAGNTLTMLDQFTTGSPIPSGWSEISKKIGERTFMINSIIELYRTEVIN